jgi:uncharacterized protein with FMN-binding domain/DMSO/TMAO reductase YedYZ heme-binding membrane subunit
MILLFALAAAAVFVRLCARPLKANPAPFYLTAALIAGLVTGLHWTAALPSAIRAYPATAIGALGTALFIFVMVVGAFPNGHPFVKRVMPVRGELSILACLLTLGHNLSYGKRYLTPGYLFSGPITPTKVAGWVSAVSIALMLVLTVTSVKAVRRRFPPRAWKALQRWAYLFYALVYLHVLLMTIPNIPRGREPYKYMVNLLVYSMIYLGYGLCRVRKGLLTRRRQWGRVTFRSQLAAAGAGAVLSLTLLGGVVLSAPSQASEPAVAAVETSQPPEASPSTDVKQPVESAPETEAETAQEPDGETSETTADQPSAEPNQTADAAPETPSPDAAPSGPAPSAVAETTAAPTTSAAAVSEPTSEPVSTPASETTPEPSPTPQSKYRDGTYTGSAPGYVGTVTVSVTISQDRITSVAVTKHMDDPEYMVDAQSGVISAILAAQSADVSAVTGATCSSEGIMDAVKAALAQAAN